MTERKKARLRRLYNLAQMIEEGEKATLSDLTRLLDISKSQLHRDLSELKHLGFDTCFDRRRNKYVLNGHPREIGRTLTVSEQLALVLCLVQLGEIKDSYLLRQSRKAALKILNHSGRVRPYFLGNALRLPKVIDGYGCNPGILKKVYSALQNRQRILIVYTKPGHSSGEYEINPYQIFMYQGNPYLDAFAWDRQEIRCFKICRINEVKFTGLTFTGYRDYDFSVQHQNSFGIYSGQKPQQVQVWFSPRAALYIREELWHHSQVIAQNPDGSIYYTVRVSEPREVLWWTLSWGEDSEVIEPLWLRKLAREKLEKMLERYENRQK
ncbi:MAG: helix-turn-helix transcriptional regulator [Desulfonatronovibrionaceae bacterium]